MTEDRTDLCSQDIENLQRLITDGQVNRREVVQAHLDRIKQVNPRVNTFVQIREAEVLAEAEAADRRHGRAIIGRLDGIPVSIKETYAVAGLATTSGLKAFAHQIADTDAPVVARMKNAGALVLGHANVPDLLIRWNTISDLYGTSRNPRDPRKSVGGSSGGDAGNVAAGMAVIGMGGDFGGSIRVPASFCGVFGLRTSAGVVPQDPFPWHPPSPALDAMASPGPLGRTVADLRAVLDVVSGPSPADPNSLPVHLSEHPERPRIAVLHDETRARIEPEVSAHLSTTVQALRHAGFSVHEQVLPDLGRAPEVWAAIVGTDCAQSLLPDLGSLIGHSGRQHIEQLSGLFALGPEQRPYAEAWLERRDLMRTMAQAMNDYPLIIAPTAGIPTPDIDFDHLLDHHATMDLFDHMRCLPWVNLFGLPALTLPNGTQLIGRRFTDLDLLATASAIEPMFGPPEIADGTAPNT